jgi:hypothetical protein
MAKPKEAASEKGEPSPTISAQFARIIAILGVNVALVVITLILAASEQRDFANVSARTLGIQLLPVSAALGLVLACRRLDLALPALLTVLIALRAHPPALLHVDATLQLLILCGIAAAVCLTSAIVTWIGRISSTLWTGLLALGLWWQADQLGPLRAGPWPWPAALAAAVGTLILGAGLLGATGLVSLPSQPPIIRSGAKGLMGLAGAWVVAGVSLALASQSEMEGLGGEYSYAYIVMFPAAAMGGAYILRGKWGAVAAVVLTGLGHLTWAFACNTLSASPGVGLAVAAVAPLAAVPLYLFIDWTIRKQTGESAPTGLLA